MSHLLINRRTLLRRSLELSAGVGVGVALLGPMRFALAEPTTLADIKARGEMRMGVEATYPPFIYRDKGEIIGYDADLADIFCANLGVKPNFIDTQWSGVIPSLYAGRFDMIMAAMSYTKERLEKVAFSIPYAEASQALLIRAEDAEQIKSIDDLSGKVLGIKLGSPGETMQAPLGERLTQARGESFSSVKTYDDHPSAYLALAQGSVDGVLNTLPTLGQVLKDRPGEYAIVRGVGRENWAGLAARKEDTEIITFLNAEIDKLKASGKIYELQEKWFGFRMNLADQIPSFG